MRRAVCFLSLWLVSHAGAADLGQVDVTAKRDLQDALDRLALQRRDLQAKKIPLVREVNSWGVSRMLESLFPRRVAVEEPVRSAKCMCWMGAVRFSPPN